MPSVHHKVGFTMVLLALGQSIAAPAASTVVLFFSTYLRGTSFDNSYLALAIISALLFFLFMRAHMPEPHDSLVSAWTIATRVILAWMSVIGVLLLLGYATKLSAIYSRQALFLWFLATPPLATAMLVLLRQLVRQSLIKSGNARSAVIAGVNDVSCRLAAKMQNEPELGLKFCGFFDDRSINRLGDIKPELLRGDFTELVDFVKDNRIDLTFIAIPMTHVRRAMVLLDELRDTTSSIYFVPDIFMFDLIQARADDLQGIPIVAICETPFRGWQSVRKRASDIVLASLMLLVALPTMIVIALGIKLSSGGGVVFKQKRYGLDGHEIVVYKFRTMTVSENGGDIAQARKNDGRVTRFGRFLRRYSLDELPQLINVLQGRMSVVGPRPHAVSHNEEYRKLIPGYMVRHKVTPGITGLAQVNGCRGETTELADMEQRVRYDLEYLRQWSLLLDMKILLRTLATLFRDEKAY